MAREKGISTLVGLIIIVVFAVLAFGSIFVYQYLAGERLKLTQNELQKQGILSRPFPLAGEPSGATAGWKTFSGNGFQMYYPPDTNVMNAPTSRIVNCDASAIPNSCPKGISPGYPDKTENKNINGVDYCYYLGDDCGMGSCTMYYSYLTVKNNVCYVLDVSTGRVPTSCDVYAYPSDIQKCQIQQKTNQNLINQAISTIRFKK